jgi:hypothetical protein
MGTFQEGAPGQPSRDQDDDQQREPEQLGAGARHFYLGLGRRAESAPDPLAPVTPGSRCAG